MEIVNKLLGRTEEYREEFSVGKSTVVGMYDDYSKGEDHFYAPNADRIRNYIEDLPQNAEASLEDRVHVEGREQIRELYDAFFDGIDTKHEYLMASGQLDDSEGELTIEVGEIEQVSYRFDAGRGCKRRRTSSKLPSPGVGRSLVKNVDLENPTYQMEINWERTKN